MNVTPLKALNWVQSANLPSRQNAATAAPAFSGNRPAPAKLPLSGLQGNFMVRFGKGQIDQTPYRLAQTVATGQWPLSSQTLEQFHRLLGPIKSPLEGVDQPLAKEDQISVNVVPFTTPGYLDPHESVIKSSLTTPLYLSLIHI